MNLELGAGYRPTPGFVHNDANPGPDIDIVWPAERITEHEQVSLGSVDHLRATHLLEHFSYQKTVEVLQEWGRALKEGGELYLEVPNFEWQTRAHAKGEIGDVEAVNYVFGEQDYEGNFHYAGFTEDLLHQRLTEAGFTNVQISDIGQVLIAHANKGIV